MNEEESIKPDSKLDCIGLYCPVPIFNTTQEMEKLNAGEVLELVTDDPAAVQDIPRWSKRAGHQLIKLYKKDDHFYFLIRKGE